MKCFNPHPIRRPHAATGLANIGTGYPVSILIRSEDRMQQEWGNYIESYDKFQSSSDPQTGCSRAAVERSSESISFNPHPIRRPDAAWITHYWDQDEARFNPHAIRRPDAARRCLTSPTVPKCFNPHPIRRPDAAIVAGDEMTKDSSFNPHPIRRPDAARKSRGLAKRLGAFQSSSDP